MYRVLNRSKEPRNHHDFLYAIGVRRSILETSEWVSAVRNPERREQNSDYHLEPGDPQKRRPKGDSLHASGQGFKLCRKAKGTSSHNRVDTWEKISAVQSRLYDY